MQEYFVYILFSEKLNKYYIGSTSDIINRLELHHAGKSKFTSSGIPWRLCYTETFSSLHDAMVREHEIKKKKSRKYIEWLISKN